MLNGQTEAVVTNHVQGPWFYWFPVIVYAGLIFYLSSLSHPEEYVPSVIVNLGDKIMHAAEYGVLGVLCYRAFRYAAGAWAARQALALAILASIAYGFTDEFHQAFVPLRQFDGWDLLTDGLGASASAVGWQFSCDYFFQRKKGRPWTAQTEDEATKAQT